MDNVFGSCVRSPINPNRPLKRYIVRKKQERLQNRNATYSPTYAEPVAFLFGEGFQSRLP